MEKISQFRKNAPFLAAVACLLYEALSLSGSGSFINGVVYVAILIAGLCCYLEKPKVEAVCVIALATASVFLFFGLIRDLIDVCTSSGTYVAQGILELFFNLFRLAAVVGMAALTFFNFKKKPFSLSKYWYGPAAIIAVYAVIMFFFRIIFYFINLNSLSVLYTPSGWSVLKFFVGAFSFLIANFSLAVGLAAIGVHTYSKSE